MNFWVVTHRTIILLMVGWVTSIILLLSGENFGLSPTLLGIETCGFHLPHLSLETNTLNFRPVLRVNIPTP